MRNSENIPIFMYKDNTFIRQSCIEYASIIRFETVTSSIKLCLTAQYVNINVTLTTEDDQQLEDDSYNVERDSK